MDIFSNPYYQKAMDFAASHDLAALEKGTYMIEEGRAWVNIVEGTKHPLSEARLEAHNDFYDVHIPLTAEETYGIRDRDACTRPVGTFDTKDDYILYDDAPAETLTVLPGSQLIFAPDTAHAPMIGEGPIKKAIFKVRVL